MKTIKKRAYAIMFFFVILLFSVLGFVLPEKRFSEHENRYLSSKPSFSFSSYVNGKFSSEYEEYIDDQFPGRDTFITIKSLSETLTGKIENNSIIEGKDGYMFEKQLSYDSVRLSKNIDLLKQFSETYSSSHRILFSIIPSSYAVLSDKFPANGVNIDQIAASELVYDNLADTDIETVDVYKTLKAHSDEYIYYKTDHHWTTLGAYYGYESICDALGKTPVALDELEYKDINEFFGTYYSKAKTAGISGDTIRYYEIDAEISVGDEEKPSLYDYSQFEKRDKYAAFIYGNNGFTHISSKNEKAADSLLIIKDSFSNCMVPFLSFNYKDIYVVDLRHFPAGISYVMENYNPEDILVMYNFNNLADDTYFSRIIL